MRKVIFTLVFAFFAVSSQAQVFQKGTNMVNVGIGFGTTLGGSGNARPAISASFEHGQWEVGGPGVISWGGYVGNTGFSYGSGGYKMKWNYTIVGARAAYHYNGFEDAPNLDVYGGAMLSYNILSFSDSSGILSGANSYGSNLGFTGFLGGRYMFSDKLGAFAELGYGISTVNVGLTIKF